MSTTNDKVTALPTSLERIGRRIDQAWQRIRKGEAEWLEGTLELAPALLEGRKQFPSNNDFSVWLKESGHDYLEKNDRAALIKMASDLTEARKVLTETDRRSYRHIWTEYKSRFPHVGKTESPSNTDRTADSNDASESDTTTSDGDPKEYTYTPREKHDRTDQQSNQRTMSDHWRDPKSLTKAVKTTLEFIARYEQEMPKRVALEYMNNIILRLNVKIKEKLKNTENSQS